MNSVSLASPAPRQQTKAGWLRRRAVALGLGGSAAAITFLFFYLQLFIFPHAAIVPWGDPVLFLENGRRILMGQLPYRDYLQFTTPGTDLFYALLLRIWGARAWIPNLLMVVLAAATVLLVTLITRRLVSGAAIQIPAFLLIGFVFPNSLYATHHWFSTLA